MEELHEYRHYVSDTEFNDAFVDEGFNPKLETFIVVENLPQVPEAKVSKLTDFVMKIYSNLGKVVENGIFMPTNKEGNTEGFAIIEFASKEDADKAVASTNGWDFDSKHKLRVFPYEQAKEYLQEPNDSEWKAPPVRELKFASDPYYWLGDEGGRDQFAISWLNSAKEKQQEVLWSDAKRAPALEFAGDKDYKSVTAQAWSNAQTFRWSPKGTYLATIAGPGVRLWSGSAYCYGHGFGHSGVKELHFSPSEAHLLTWNGCEGNAHPEKAAILWDLRTGEQLRAFKQRRPEDDSCDMQWSADGKLLARLEHDSTVKTELIKVYDASNNAFALLDKKSLKVPGAVEFSWCPATGSNNTNLLAWWSPERENAPASVQVLRFPSRELVRQRNLFNVETLTLAWHPEGAYLAVLASKATKKKTKPEKLAPLTLPTSNAASGTCGWTIELFRLREKDVPVQVLEVSEHVRGLFWEPSSASGHRFAVVTDHPTVRGHYNISFYDMQAEGAAGAGSSAKAVESTKPTLLFTLEEKPYNAVSWSPKGEFAVLTTASNLTSAGRYEFYDVERRKSLGTAEHPNATGHSWDPSGRCLASYKTSGLKGGLTRDEVDNGYRLYSFQGEKLFETLKVKLMRFEWRPRPASLLTEEEVKAVSKSLRTYITRFQEEDKKADNRKKLLERLYKRKQRDEFRSLLAARHAEWDSRRAERELLRGRPDYPNPTEAALDVIIEETYEKVVEEKIEMIA